MGFRDKLGSFHLEPAAWWWNGLKGIGAIGNASQKSLTRLIERRGFQGNSDVSSAKWNDAELTEVMHTSCSSVVLQRPAISSETSEVSASGLEWY